MSDSRQPPTLWKPAKNMNHNNSMKPLLSIMPSTWRTKSPRLAKAPRMAARAAWA